MIRINLAPPAPLVLINAAALVDQERLRTDGSLILFAGDPASAISVIGRRI